MRDKDEFSSGVNSALAVLASYGEEAMWREVVAACGGDKVLRAHSKRNGNLEIDGFERYGRQKRTA